MKHLVLLVASLLCFSACNPIVDEKLESDVLQTRTMGDEEQVIAERNPDYPWVPSTLSKKLLYRQKH